MPAALSVSPRFRPVLDPGFLPASLWNRAYRSLADAGGARPLAIALERSDGGVSVFRTATLPHEGGNIAVNQRYAERLLKYLLWQKGGCRVTVAGEPRIADYLRAVYSPQGARAFDYHFMGERVYGRPMTIGSVPYDACPDERESAAPLGRHLDGCRIGFDLGASDRKCAAVADGKVIFSDEVAWNPSAQADPQYHFDGINDSLRRAAAQLPHVDAIGGSAAGVYVNNEVRIGSLYRSVPRDLFDSRIRRLFFDLRAAWGIPVLQLDELQLARLHVLLTARGARVAAVATPIGKTAIDAPFHEEIDRLERAFRTWQVAPLGDKS